MDLTTRIQAVEMARAIETGHLETLEAVLGPLVAVNQKVSANVRRAEQTLAAGIALTEVRKVIELEALELLLSEDPGNGIALTVLRGLVAKIAKQFDKYQAPTDLIAQAKTL